MILVLFPQQRFPHAILPMELTTAVASLPGAQNRVLPVNGNLFSSILRKVKLMIQSTMRQQVLAGILVSGCFLAGTICEQFLQRQSTAIVNPTSMVISEPAIETMPEAGQLTRR